MTEKEEGKDLAIKEIAPRVRRGVPAERLKVPKTGHLSRLDCTVAEGDRLDRNGQDKLVVVPNVCWGSGLRMRQL